MNLRARLSSLAFLLLSAAAPARELRVCADPNNLPYSNAAGEGFENRIMEVIASDLGASVKYTWWAQRRGFARNTLNAETCDVPRAGRAGDEARRMRNRAPRAGPLPTTNEWRDHAKVAWTPSALSLQAAGVRSSR